MLNCKGPRLRCLIRIGRTDDRKPWNSTQVGEVLDWLVSRAILPESDAVVRKNVDRFEIAQGPQADGRLHVAGKIKNDALNGSTTPRAATPIPAAPMACSRTPKAMFRPA